MKTIFRNFLSIFFIGFILSACDLQPKISSFPDSVGDFISNRYPALLADSETQPEIYNAAATDYGIYADSETYGTDAVNDYTLYSDLSDYKLEPQTPVKKTDASTAQKKDLTISEKTITQVQPDYLNVPAYNYNQTEIITIGKGDTLYSISRKYSVPVNDLAVMNKLSAPFALSVGQKINVPKTTEVKTIAIGVQKTETVIVPPVNQSQVLPIVKIPAPVIVPSEIVVAAGDTLYSISRKYSVPVNEIIDANKLKKPYDLRAGQKLKIKTVAVKTSDTSKNTDGKKANDATKPIARELPKTITPAQNTTIVPKQTIIAREKISSNPTTSLPKITPRAGAKFSWPLRGSIISAFGAKSNGLYNDGINISAKLGENVFASENGVVAYAGNEVKGMGNLIIVQHADGWMTVYGHLDSMNVRRGNIVSVNQKIGNAGKTGKVDKPQLHFEIRKGTRAYDPASYLKK